MSPFNILYHISMQIIIIMKTSVLSYQSRALNANHSFCILLLLILAEWSNILRFGHRKGPSWLKLPKYLRYSQEDLCIIPLSGKQNSLIISFIIFFSRRLNHNLKPGTVFCGCIFQCDTVIPLIRNHVHKHEANIIKLSSLWEYVCILMSFPPYSKITNITTYVKVKFISHLSLQNKINNLSNNIML